MDNESQQAPYAQNAVSAVVWPWAAPLETDTARGHSVAARLFRWIVPMCIAALFWFGWWIFDSRIAACAIAAVTTTLLVLSFVAMPAYDAVMRGVFKVAAWIGTAMAWIVLVPFYYLVFPLGRLSGLVKGRDPLRRGFPFEGPSCWVDRPPIDRDDYYEKQFSKVARD